MGSSSVLNTTVVLGSIQYPNEGGGRALTRHFDRPGRSDTKVGLTGKRIFALALHHFVEMRPRIGPALPQSLLEELGGSSSL